MGVIGLMLVYLVNQNFIAGSAKSISVGSLSMNPTAFSANPSQTSNVVSTSYPQTSSTCLENEIIALSFIPSQQTNSKNGENSLQTNQNGFSTNAPKPSLLSSPLNLRFRPKPPTVNNFAGSLNNGEFQNDRLPNFDLFENAMSSPFQNNVLPFPSRSANYAQESFISPTLPAPSYYRGKPSTLNIVNTNYNIDNSHNPGGSNAGFGIKEIKPIRFNSDGALNFISLATPSGLNEDTLNVCANENIQNEMVSRKGASCVSLSSQSVLNTAQSTFNLNRNSENVDIPSNLDMINGDLNTVSSQSSGLASVSTKCPTVMAPTNVVNSAFTTFQNGFDTVTPSASQSPSCFQGSDMPPSQLTQSLSDRKVKPGKPHTLNIINSNLNVAKSQNSGSSNFDINTQVTSDNLASLFAQNNLNNMILSQPQSSSCDQGNTKSSTQCMSSSINPYSTDSGKPSPVFFFPTNFNIVPTQTQENIGTDNSISQSTVLSSTGSVNFLSSSNPTLSNCICTSTDQDSLTGTKINDLSNYMASLNQVPNPLSILKSIPPAKPCLSSISGMLESSPISSLNSELRNNLQNSDDFFLPGSHNNNIRSPQNFLSPSANNPFFSSQITISKDSQSEEASFERNPPENLKAKLSPHPSVSSSFVHTSDQLQNIYIPSSYNNNNNNYNNNNKNNNYLFSFPNSLNLRPSSSAKSNNIQPNIPHTVNVISPTLSPLSSILGPTPVTISQNSDYCSQKSIPVSLNIVKPSSGSETTFILPSGNALNSNSPVSLSSQPFTLPNIPNELSILSQSQPLYPKNLEINNKVSFSNNLNQQLSSCCQSSSPCTENALSRPSFLSSISAPSQSDNPLSLVSVCNCNSNTLTSDSGMSSPLTSSNTLSSNSRLSSSSCACNSSPEFPKESTKCSTLIQDLNTPCTEYKSTPLLPASNLNQEQTLTCSKKSKFPHTVNILTPKIPNSIPFIPSSVPSVNSQNLVSVCNCQTNTPGSSNLLQFNDIQGSGKASSLSFGNTLSSVSSLTSPCLCDQFLNIDTPKQNLLPNVSPVLVPNNVYIKYDRPSSYSAYPATYQQVLSLTDYDGLNSFESVSNPAYAYSGSVPIIPNPYSCNVAAPSTISFPYIKPTDNLSLLPSRDTLPSLQPVVPVKYITSPFSSPVIDSYNTWVPSLVETLLSAFDPQILVEALCQDKQGKISPYVSRIISTSNGIDAKTILESLLQDSQFEYKSQNYPFIIDNEPIILDKFPWQPTQFIDFSSDDYPSPIYEQLDFYYTPSDCLYDDIDDSSCSSSYTTYPLQLPPQIIMYDDGSDDSDSAEEFLKWMIFCELCNRCNGLDPYLALALAS